ncbi:prevent-host-death family protein [Devosia enhydra]|uniref:Antitoxin n=1 Tax=Devosia enhydra TaxID=665118 RepID=A0A1K2HUI0_9HYPH|nr:type II toxin-antitoxin system Phd/YefM family antitoxin [Devosia enhydra]SFZ81187.1 prevent-host-death family protein [Devosia enhydra]
MATLSAAEAKARFSDLLDAARSEPVYIEEDGRSVAVVVSAQEFEALKAAARSGISPGVREALQESLSANAAVYRALAK